MKGPIPLHISINGRFLTQRQTGVQRYAFELVKALDGLLEKGDLDHSAIDVCLLAPRRLVRDIDLRHVRLIQFGNFTGHLWEQLELPGRARKGILLNLANTAPLSIRNQIVVIHDAAVFAKPETFSRPFRMWYQFLLPRVANAAKAVVTVSQFSRQELIRYCGIRQEKVRVIYEGADQMLRFPADYSILDDNNLSDRPYVLAVSSLNPSKNYAGLVQAVLSMKELQVDIAVVGQANASVFRATDPPGAERMRYLGYVSDRQLRALYERATCFVYPSLYEGFGLPPLEAMACGTPVAVSRAASIPEVCGDAAMYFDPSSPGDMARALTAMLGSSSLREDFARRGLQHVSKYTWEQAARSMYALVRRLTVQRGT